MARKEKKYHFIYKTTNLLNSKYYIGMHSTDDLNDGYMGSGKRLRCSINKYGKEKHKIEILEFLNTREELINKEIEIVNLNEIAKEECMNLMIGGKGGFISEDQQRNRSIAGGKAFAARLKNDKKFKQKNSKRLSKLIKRTHKSGKFKYDNFNKNHSEETKKLMSESSKGIGLGRENSQYGTCWITKNGVNKKIKKEKIDKWLNNGWVKGRKLRKNDEKVTLA